jgi:GntR family transcriptional repressor for pyruvate dehydrogenase complex
MGGNGVDRVDRLSVTDAIVERIVEYVRSSHLEPGDKLPGEYELIRILGVSRMSVREALRSLAATGLIEPQAGLGTFVAKPSLLTFMAHGPLPSLLTDSDDVKQFFEARRALEPQILALAAKRATAADLESIRSSLFLMQETVEAGTFDDIPWLDFHRALFQACHNRLLIEMATPIMEMLELLFPSTVTAHGKKMSKEQSQRSIDIHRELCEAVASKDSTRAHRAAISHIELAEEELLVALKDGDGDLMTMLATAGLDPTDRETAAASVAQL